MSGNIFEDEPFVADGSLFVAKNGNDGNSGSSDAPFLTIQAGIDYIYNAGMLNDEKYVILNVAPGIYEEQIHSYTGLFIRGGTNNVPSNEKQPVVLYNTGVDEASRPLRGYSTDDYWLKNMVVRTDAGGVFGKLSNNYFNSVKFEGGEFVENLDERSLYTVYKNCAFLNCAGFNLTGVAQQGRYIVFEQCWMGWNETARFESTHAAGNAVFDMDGGHLAFTGLSVKGDWYHFAKNCHSFGSVRHEYGTSKGISYRNVTISNGIHFTAAPLSFQMIGCNMDDAAESPVPAGEADITSDIPISDCNFVGNEMHNGLCGCIQIRGIDKNVGSTSMNKYLDLDAAIASIAAGDSGTIHLHEDITDQGELNIAAGSSITIKGGKLYSIAFTGKVVELGSNQSLNLHELSYLDGTEIEINGDSAYLGIEGCLTVETNIVSTSGTGSMVLAYYSSLLSKSNGPCIKVDNVYTLCVVGYSRLKGSAGNPAILFTVDADGKLKTKYSTFIHGSGGTNSPLSYTGDGKVDISMYSCALNANYSADDFNNSIVGANNTVDASIDY